MSASPSQGTGTRQAASKADLRARAWFYGGMAILGMGLSLAIAASRIAFRHRAVRAPATVVTNVKKPGNRGDAYCPVFSVVTPQGEQVRANCHHCSNSQPEFQPGQHVDVLYDPADLGSVEPADDPAPIWLLAVVSGLIGLASGVSALWFRRRSMVALTVREGS